MENGTRKMDNLTPTNLTDDDIAKMEGLEETTLTDSDIANLESRAGNIEPHEGVFMQAIKAIGKGNEQAAGGAREFLRNPGGREDSYMKGFNDPSSSETFTQQLTRQNIEQHPEQMKGGLLNTPMAFINSLPYQAAGETLDIATNPINALAGAGIQKYGGVVAKGVGNIPTPFGKNVGQVAFDIGNFDPGNAFQKGIRSAGKGMKRGYDVLKRGGSSAKKRMAEIKKMGESEISGLEKSALSDELGVSAVGKRTRAGIDEKSIRLNQEAEDQAAKIAAQDGLNAEQQEITRKNILAELQSKSGELSKQKSGLSSTLESTAKKEAIDAEEKYVNYLGKRSKEWESEVDDIASKHGGVEIDSNSIADDIENKLIEKRNLSISKDVKNESIGGENTNDNFLLGVADRLRNKGAINLQEALQEVSSLGKKMKSGSGYSSNDHLLNEVRDIILSKAEKSTGNSGEITSLRKAWAEFAQERNYAINKYGFFSKYGRKYNEKGREFIQKTATGGSKLEEKDLAESLGKKIGTVGEESSKIGSEISKVDLEISRIDDEIKSIIKNPIQASTNSKAYLESAKKKITESIQKEISDLENEIAQRSGNIRETARNKIQESAAKTSKGQQSMSDLKRKLEKRQKQLIKAVALTTVGTFITFRRQLGGLIGSAIKLVS